MSSWSSRGQVLGGILVFLYVFITGFLQASLCKIQVLLKDFPTVFKD